MTTDDVRSHGRLGGSRFSDPVRRWAPGATVAAGAVWLMVANGVSPIEVFRYAAYWVVTLVVPGVLVLRWLRGRSADLVEELSLGALTGLCLEIAFAVCANILAIDRLAPWWFVLPYLALLVPRARAAVQVGRWERRESVGQAWAIAGIASMVLVSQLGTIRSRVLPPNASTVNIDEWWHLSLVREMLRPGLPVDPQVAGEPLVYHWFSHMHLAVAGQTSGVDPVVVQLRLWWVPFVPLTVGLVVVLGRVVVRRSWAGPLTAWITFLAVAGGVLWSGGLVTGGGGLTTSPSQVVSIAATVGASSALVTLARRRLSAGELAWLVFLVVVSLGMKPTAVPVMLCGAGFATVVVSLLERRVQWRLAGMTAVLLAAMAAALLITRTPGNTTLLGSLHSMWPYNELIANGPRAMSEGLLVDTLVGRRAWAAALSALAVVVVGNALRFMGLAVLGLRETRRDAAAWYLAGAYLAGWAAVLLVDHPSRSQFYFLGTVAALGSVLGTWLVSLVVDRTADRTPDGVAGPPRVWLAVLAGLAGANIAWLAREVPGLLPGQAVGLLDRVWIPIVVSLVGLAAVALVAARIAPRSRRREVVGLVVVMAVVGLAVPASLGRNISEVAQIWAPEDPVDEDTIDFLTAAEQEAALWLDANAGPLDVVATNVHCRPAQQDVESCDTRGYWVSGLSGRRVLLGGWAYTGRAHALHGVDGRSYSHQPSPWPLRLELSQAAFTDPTDSVMAQLRGEGVRWLVGDRRAGDVSPRVSDFASLAFENDLVSIWRLPA